MKSRVAALRIPSTKLALKEPTKRAPPPKTVTTATLTSRTCRWPIGDPVEAAFHYCGQLPQLHRRYCDIHERLSYQPVRHRKP